MAISSAAIASFEQISQTRFSSSQTTTRQGQGADKVELTTVQERRDALNTTILQSQVSISSQNEPLSLMLKSALEGINKELEPTLGKNAAQKAFDEGIDFSPEATAARIVDFATSFFPLYQQQQQGNGDSLEQQLDSFLGVVGGGVDKGFGEAKDILSGLNVFNGDIEENANNTYDLIFEGFAKFKDNVMGATEQQAQQTESAS